MGASNSTTLVIVGGDAPRLIEGLDRYPNVQAATLAETPDDYAERWVATAHTPYLVHDRDPLAHVAAAWVEFFDDLSTLGTLDLEVDRALAAFRQGHLNMPDYYLVVDPESLPPTWKHWWLGVLPEAAPTRVIPWEADGPLSIARVLRTLPTSRQWPEPDPWLRSVARSVPDRVGLGDHSAPPADSGTDG